MSPRSEEQFARMRHESRERIVGAALSLFARHGYEGTSIRMIAREADISLGLMYNYFPGKEELLRSIFQRGMDEVRESFARIPAEMPPRERLASLVRGALGAVRANLEFWRLSYGLRMQPAVLEGLSGEVEEWTREIHAALQGLLAAAGAREPALEAAVLFGQIDGVAQHFALDPRHYPLDAVVERIVARYCEPGGILEPTD